MESENFSVPVGSDNDSGRRGGKRSKVRWSEGKDDEACNDDAQPPARFSRSGLGANTFSKRVAAAAGDPRVVERKSSFRVLLEAVSRGVEVKFVSAGTNRPNHLQAVVGPHSDGHSPPQANAYSSILHNMANQSTSSAPAAAPAFSVSDVMLRGSIKQKLSSSILENKAPEILMSIMQAVDDPDDLQNLIIASRRLRAVFKEGKQHLIPFIFIKFFLPEVMNDVVPLAKWLVQMVGARRVGRPAKRQSAAPPGFYIDNETLYPALRNWQNMHLEDDLLQHQEDLLRGNADPLEAQRPPDSDIPLSKETLYAISYIAPVIRWFISDFASRKLVVLEQYAGPLRDTTLPKYAYLDGGSPPVAPLSTVEQGRLQRALLRFEFYTWMFKAEPDHNTIRHAEFRRNVFLAFLRPWEVEELATIHDYLQTRIVEKIQEVEDWFVNNGNAIEEVKNHPYFSTLAKCLHHPKQIEQLMALGLEFLNRLFESKGQELLNNLLEHEEKRNPAFLSSALELPHWPRLSSPNHVEMIARALNIQQKFEGDFLAKRPAGWVWYCDNRAQPQYNNQDGVEFRDFAGVFWDEKRLRVSGILDAPYQISTTGWNVQKWNISDEPSVEECLTGIKKDVYPRSDAVFFNNYCYTDDTATWSARKGNGMLWVLTNDASKRFVVAPPDWSSSQPVALHANQVVYLSSATWLNSISGGSHLITDTLTGRYVIADKNALKYQVVDPQTVDTDALDAIASRIRTLSGYANEEDEEEEEEEDDSDNSEE